MWYYYHKQQNEQARGGGGGCTYTPLEIMPDIHNFTYQIQENYF